MNAFEIVVGIVGVGGVLLTGWFGLRSMFQTQYLESLEKALRAYNQGMYNNLWRIGEGAERALKVDSLAEAQQFAKGVAEISQTARHTLLAFSKEHTRFVPFHEPAWEPAPLAPEPSRNRWQRFFRI
jgi:hypothetical protein